MSSKKNTETEPIRPCIYSGCKHYSTVNWVRCFHCISHKQQDMREDPAAEKVSSAQYQRDKILTERTSLTSLINELKTSNDSRDTAIAITGFLKRSDPHFLPRSVVVDLKDILEDRLKSWSQDL